ncbi:MAG: hypothetical protein PHX18_07665 [Candidatus Gastranaerophilales bacterium]|nr:hypothetical protein [Candidatus Gastranaerophilales bacterium]
MKIQSIRTATNELSFSSLKNKKDSNVPSMKLYPSAILTASAIGITASLVGYTEITKQPLMKNKPLMLAIGFLGACLGLGFFTFSEATRKWSNYFINKEANEKYLNS